MLERCGFFPLQSIFNRESDVVFCVSNGHWKCLTASEAGRNGRRERATRAMGINITAKRGRKNLKPLARREDVGRYFCAEVTAFE